MKCSTCALPAVRRFVDASPDMTAAALSRQAAEVGMDISTERILNHRKHLAAEPPVRPKYERKVDFAIKVRDRAADMFDNEQLDLSNKDHVPGISAGLKAQSLLDGREKAKARQGTAELAFAIIAMLTGAQPAALEIEDGLTIEGDAVEVDDE